MYRIGAKVFCRDGEAGKLIKVAIDPHTRRITDLIVERGLLLARDRVLPVDLVGRIDEEGIHLSISSAELRSYPEYREQEFVISDPNLLEELGYEIDDALVWQHRYGAILTGVEPITPRIRERVHLGVSPDRRVIGRGTPVRNALRTIGTIHHLLVDERTGEITHLVVRRGLLPYRVIIPIQLVDSVDDEGVYVPLTREKLEQLERFSPRADQDILTEIEDKLAGIPDLDFDRLTVSLKDGVVRLAGTVRDAMSRKRIEEMIRSVSGVLGVENDLTAATRADDPVREPAEESGKPEQNRGQPGA